MKLKPEIREHMAAVAAEEGLELLAVEVVGSGPKTVLRLVVDGPNGVSLDQCASVSRQTSVMLDVEDPFSHRYTLEVSSPGLDRKLYSAADYEKFAGRRVKIRMQPSYREHRTAVGELLGIDATMVRLRDDSGTELRLPLDEVFETRLEVDWSVALKEGKTRG
jgi:ribosome maturation factor RimP